MRHKHEPDMHTATIAEDTANEESVIVDFWCSICGESGSTIIKREDITFYEESEGGDDES